MTRNLLRFLLSGTLLCCSVMVTGQEADPNYQDGKIWFKLEANVLIPASPGSGNNIPFTTLPFLESMREYGLSGLSRPFAHIKDNPALSNVYQLEFTSVNRADELVRKLAGAEIVVYAEKVPLYRPCFIPNDPGYQYQWALPKVSAPAAWDISQGSVQPKIAVVDDAVELQHPDLVMNIWNNPAEIAGNGVDDDLNGFTDDMNGYDVASNDNNPNPPNPQFNHGTPIAGIVSARTGNVNGVASLASRAKIIAVKATTTPGMITHGYEGILYAAAAGANIINVSWGGPAASATGEQIINYAVSKGCLIVAAAGNDNSSAMFYPAAYNNVLAVAATGTQDQKANFSNYGSWVNVSAPGVNIYSTGLSSGYTYVSGTSAAAAHVSSLAGLIRGHSHFLPAIDIEICITSNTDNISAQNPGLSGMLGAGRINAFKSLQCANNTLAYAPQAEFTSDVNIIYQGDAVNFTNLSIYNPTSYSWTFTGGTPATHTGINPPPIVYGTPGTYDVKLTVTNANGSNTMTKTGWIVVNSATGCDTITNTLPGDTAYTWTIGTGGYLGGHNNIGINKWAEFYSNYAPNTHVMGANFFFVRGKTNGPNATINVQMWDDSGTNGGPGTVLATKTVKIQEIAAHLTTSQQFMEILFDNPVTITGDFYIGVSVTPNSGDTVAIALTQNLINSPRPNSAWGEYLGNWLGMDQIFTGNPEMAFFISPLVTSSPVTADFTPLNPTICAGDTIQFNSTTTGTSNVQWFSTGSVNSLVNLSVADIAFHTGGTDTVILRAYNSCGYPNEKLTTVTVNPKPNITVQANPGLTICEGSSTNLAVFGAQNVSWTPGTGLSSTTGQSVTANPDSTTTYVVQGDLNGCIGQTYLEIKVTRVPVIEATVSDTTPCIAYRVKFDATNTLYADAYSWHFPGGTPTFSSLVSDSVLFPATGPVTATLIASNSCGGDTMKFNLNVMECAGVEENGAGTIYSWYAPVSQSLNLLFRDQQTAIKGELLVHDVSGRIVQQATLESDAGSTFTMDVSMLPPGTYMISLRGANATYSSRFVKGN